MERHDERVAVDYDTRKRSAAAVAGMRALIGVFGKLAPQCQQTGTAMPTIDHHTIIQMPGQIPNDITPMGDITVTSQQNNCPGGGDHLAFSGGGYVGGAAELGVDIVGAAYQRQYSSMSFTNGQTADFRTTGGFFGTPTDGGGVVSGITVRNYGGITVTVY